MSENNADQTAQESVRPKHFIEHIIDEDLASGKHQSIVTRFPPEPNGFLHIGHAKSICLNFGLAQAYQGACHLRFDDTNPEKESQEYIDAIQRDVLWLGGQWTGPVRYASGYFDALYDYAVELIKQGKAYVCSLNAEEVREYRGTLTEPGKDSPFRARSVDENLDLFSKMKAGEFKEGEHALRAKIDMGSPNINLRDPVIYRIRHAHHHQTGDQWCIYPTYDYTHALSDAIELITHSLCTLEFEDHRPLYDWVVEQVKPPGKPRQIEFARLNLNYTVTSKRKLKALVDEQVVSGWDDPRMPTIAGLRRRGYTAKSIRNFCEAIGVTKSDGVVDVGMLEYEIRDDLDKSAPRAMCVLRPLKVVITNYPDDKKETLQAPLHPKQDLGYRDLPFGSELYIDQDDFTETPPPKYFRLAPGKEVRLRNAYVIKCEEVVKDDDGRILELRCTYDDKTLGKKPEGRKVKGVIHWVSATDGVPCQVRLYDRLFRYANPESPTEEELAEYPPVEGSDAGDFHQALNPDSCVTVERAIAEPSLLSAKPEAAYQFEREGYFCLDGIDSTDELKVFNRTVTLKDSWEKITKK